MKTAIAILAACLLAGCASTNEPKPAGAMLDPVLHTEIINVTVDNE